MRSKLKGISLFSSAGIGELYFDELGIEIVVANELIEKRADCHKHIYPSVPIICGDIKKENIKNKIKSYIGEEIKLLVATPPCQGISTLGKNKSQNHFESDTRNYLIFDSFDLIDFGKFDFILIENVPRFLKMLFPYKGGLLTIEEILLERYSKDYSIEAAILDAKDYGVAQTRPRAIIKMYKNGLKWGWPPKEKEITVREAIGHLPSLEPGEKSDIPLHFAKKHREQLVWALKNTPEGKSALKNETHYPKKEDGARIKGFHNTFKRMSWSQPAHARTTYCGSISSHNNVHPGRALKDGTYSDARVLTLLETFIVSSLPEDFRLPDWASDSFSRTMIGESIPPLMMKKILSQINIE